MSMGTSPNNFQTAFLRLISTILLTTRWERHPLLCPFHARGNRALRSWCFVWVLIFVTRGGAWGGDVHRGVSRIPALFTLD